AGLCPDEQQVPAVATRHIWNGRPQHAKQALFRPGRLDREKTVTCSPKRSISANSTGPTGLGLAVPRWQRGRLLRHIGYRLHIEFGAVRCWRNLVDRRQRKPLVLWRTWRGPCD